MPKMFFFYCCIKQINEHNMRPQYFLVRCFSKKYRCNFMVIILTITLKI